MKLQQLSRYLQRNGFRETAAKLFGFFRGFFFYRNDLVLLVKHPFFVPDDPFSVPTGFSIHRPGISDLDWLSRDMVMEADEIARRLRRGDACACIVADGHVAASAWGAFEVAEIPEIFLRSELPSGGGYICTVECGRKFRRRGLAKAAVREIERIAFEKSVKTMAVAVHPDNRASMQLFKRLGYRPFKQVFVSRFLGIKRYQEEVIEAEHIKLLAPQSLDGSALEAGIG